MKARATAIACTLACTLLGAPGIAVGVVGVALGAYALVRMSRLYHSYELLQVAEELIPLGAAFLAILARQADRVESGKLRRRAQVVELPIHLRGEHLGIDEARDKPRTRDAVDFRAPPRDPAGELPR